MIVYIKRAFKYFLKPFLHLENTARLIRSTRILTVGKMTYHNGNFVVKGDQFVHLGSYCAFGKNVTIVTSNHDYNYPCIQGKFYDYYFKEQHPGVLQNPPNRERTKGGVSIGSDVWIADNVTILSGVTIGDGVCIASNTVVTKSIEPYSIVGGIPGKLIGMRYTNEVIDLFNEIKWWNWDERRIIDNKTFFNLNINQSSIKQIKDVIV